MTDQTYFNSLAEPQKKAFTSASYKILRSLSDKQIGLLIEAEHNPRLLSERNHFIFQITRSFWKDFDFAYSLRNGKYDTYAVYPVRTMMEKLLKTVQFNKLSIDQQDEIVKKELLCEIKRNFDLSGEDDGIYDKVNVNGKYPPLSEVNLKDLKTFAPYDQLCSNFKNKKNLYGFYQWLSGIPHGNLAHIMFQKTLGTSEYRRVMMMAVYFGYEMLLAVDINFKNSHIVEIHNEFKKIQKMIGIDLENSI